MSNVSLSVVGREPDTQEAIDAYRNAPGLLALRPAVQHYEWGDPNFIPALIGEENPGGKPYAELWMGAHPDAPSGAILGDSAVPLSELIEAAPEAVLHPAVATRFGRQLPFLFKILASAEPLSLQTHPTKCNAEEGFAREIEAGIPLNARGRNFRDTNHKPELIVALTDFYGLREFRGLPEIERQIDAVPELHGIGPDFRATPEWLRELYSNLMTLPQEEVDARLTPLVERLSCECRRKPFTKADREFWILRADRVYSHDGHRDRGLFSFYLLNLVHLRPGDAMYLPAGVLHAYLEGAGVEVMANSNNVLRGGLTPKHIDVPELLRNVTFEGGEAGILKERRIPGTQEWIYSTPAEEFELSRIELDEHYSHSSRSDHAVEVLFVQSAQTDKPITVKSGADTWTFDRGQVFLAPSGIAYELSSRGQARLFKATVPLASTAVSARPSTDESPIFRGRRPTPLTFGTSGLRGLVTDITDLEAYVNTRGFLDFLREIGDAKPGGPVSIAGDLRPSSDSPDRSIMRAVARAVSDAGFLVDHLGRLPTPALTHFAILQRRPSIMVTGSHIPFDRNGIKFNKSTGEVLKSDELGILEAVHRVRQLEYARPATESLFADTGMFAADQQRCLTPIHASARREYLRRYLDFLAENALNGKRVAFYQHSAVGRDLLVELLSTLGAQVIPVGRSENFVPVDTEAISDDKLELLQRLADRARQSHGPIDAVVSTDGDSDRPLVAGVDAGGKVHFFGGDLLGIVVADFLKADAVVVPISASDAVDRWAAAKKVVALKTRIGSPYVIEGMHHARDGGAARVVGWEANGGFLTGTDIELNGRTLKALPTRDAALPLVAALCAANELGVSLVELFAQLPHRFSKAGLIDNFPLETSRALIRRFTPADARIQHIDFAETGICVQSNDGKSQPAPPDAVAALDSIRRDLERFFCRQNAFDGVVSINTLDGIRIFFRNGDIAHIRPSGNAPQLRIYAVADTQERADGIVGVAIREPDGILRRLEADGIPPSIETNFVESIRKNITLTSNLFARGETPELIGTVSGSRAAREFWQSVLDRALEPFKARAATSFQEDLPTNQAFGLLLLWQRLKPHLRENRGSLVAFVFGEGTRSTPFTEAENAQKPAIATFVPAGAESAFLSMVELALRYFVTVQQFLRRSGFDGLVVKWGDEVQIPTRDLSRTDLLFRDADVIRFVSMREMNSDEAKNKDWVGVDSDGRVIAFIPRRPLDQMEALADRGLLQRRNGKLCGGINLGSVAVSYAFLDCLLEEFTIEVNDASARRKDRPALDPEFFTALTVAAIEDAEQRAEAWERATKESTEVDALSRRFPNVIYRLRRAIHALEERQGRKLKMVGMDFGDQYWGDIGQHAKIYEFYMALNHSGPSGEVGRAIAGLSGKRDPHGNLMVTSTVSPQVQVRDSVLINATLSGRGTVERSVLIGTRAGNVEIRDGFDVLSTVADLRIQPRGGTYKVVSAAPVHADRGERLTTLFLPALGARLFRVHEETNLREKVATYSVPILGNPLSFQQAHEEMGTLGVDVLEKSRREAEEIVLASMRITH